MRASWGRSAVARLREGQGKGGRGGRMWVRTGWRGQGGGGQGKGGGVTTGRGWKAEGEGGRRKKSREGEVGGGHRQAGKHVKHIHKLRQGSKHACGREQSGQRHLCCCLAAGVEGPHRHGTCFGAVHCTKAHDPGQNHQSPSSLLHFYPLSYLLDLSPLTISTQGPTDL